MPAPLGNIFALGNKGGRPAFFKSEEELEKRVIEYFESYVQREGEELDPALGHKPTVTGLALYLGFCDRNSLYDYRDKNDEFFRIVKKALTLVEMQYEQLLESKASTGAIFALKNMGWRDSKDITSAGEKINTDNKIEVIIKDHSEDEE